MWDQLKKRFESTESFVSLVLGLAVVLLVGMFIFNYVKGRAPIGTTNPGEAAKTEQGQQVALPTTHTVAAGDTLWSISEKYFTSGYNWVDIAKANNLASADFIEVGQTLTIPKVERIAPPEGQIAASQVEVKPATSYTAVHGDTLWSISLAHYGTGYRWVDIASTNHLANPDIIHAGNVFTLP